MPNRFPPGDKAALIAVEELLWTDWDPIGCAVPRDEYDSYASQVFSRARRGESAEQIAAYLCRIETEHMGLGHTPGVEARSLLVAAKAIQLVGRGETSVS